MNFEVANTIKLPPLPTREEVAEYCNQAMPGRKHPITVRTVRGWQERGLIKPHPSFRWPVRFDARAVVDFINGKFASKF